MKIFCPNCQKTIPLHKNIDTTHFDGDVHCENCKWWWRIEIDNSKLRKCRRASFDNRRIPIPDDLKIELTPDDQLLIESINNEDQELIDQAEKMARHSAKATR